MPASQTPDKEQGHRSTQSLRRNGTPHLTPGLSQGPIPQRALKPRRQQLLTCLLLLTLTPFWTLTPSSPGAYAAPSDPFPRPPALQPAMRFWMRIYSEFDISSGLIHDSRDLSIIYTPLYLNQGAPLASQNRVIEETIAHYRAAMLALAEGKRADLNAFEQHALEPWRRRGGQPHELREAAERIRFQRGQEDRFREGLERAQPWQPQVETIFRERGLPVGLAALPHVESSYNPKAISKVGAAGLWQFMPTTARRYIRVDEEIDERYDVIKSTQAAANLLHHNYSVLERWPLAISAYNHGLAGVRRAVRATGSHDIVRIIDEYQGNRFGFASRNFYVAFIAAHDLSVAPDRYFRPLDPSEALEVVAPAYLPAPRLAEFLGISLHDLRAVNPQMHHDVWNGKQLIARNDRLRLPPPIEQPLAERKLAEFSARFGFDGQLPLTYYDLSYGESLSGVAHRLDTSISELVAMNGLDDAHALQTGQRLRIPRGEVPIPLGPGAAILLPELLSLQTPEEDTLAIAAAALDQEPTPAPTPAQASPSPPELASQATAPTEAPPIAANTTAADQPADVAQPQTSIPSAGTPDAPPDGLPDSPADALLASVEPANATPLAETQPDLAADPTDYSVSADASIEIQVAETLGHYAQWLKVDAKQLRADNALGDDKPLMIGQRLKLDFSHISAEQFEQQRIAFHRNRQLDYFAQYRITGVAEHLIREGQSLWDIAVKTYQIPLWLLRQYNPDVETNAVLPLDRPLYVPIVETRMKSNASLTAVGNR